MSVCFNNGLGLMAGVDAHKYYADKGGAPVPIDFVPHVVGLPLFRPWARLKAHSDVTMDGWVSFETGADWYMVNHFVVPVDVPHAIAEGLQLINIYLNSGAKLWMGVFSVKIGTGNAATCLTTHTGSMLDCNDPCDLPTGFVVNLNSVVTQPTPGDYVGSWVAACWDAGIGWAIGKLIETGVGKGSEKIPPSWKRDVIDAIVESVGKQSVRRTDKIGIVDLPGKFVETVSERINQWVDGDLASGE